MPMQSQHETPAAARLSALRNRIDAAARGRAVELLAVSKTQPAEAVAALAASGQRAFGENYVQEAAAKIEALRRLDLRWHLIGHLQSNKAAQAAPLFDCIESVDRAKLLPLLDAARAASGRGPLDILLQVNIDDEASKSGCAPADLPALAEAAARCPNLSLRGLMSIPAPVADLDMRRRSFAALHDLFEQLREQHPQIDTLSMGMSEDFELAIAEGATRVRVGSALFGPRGAGNRESGMENR
ncbi:YggS family pyridoxal phosphate-dependent enzyme [uncultured Aquimonas sp.]|uniref:YggS family pyridoxal phosphate-dependent enzyme n=1 Tax=uncultured Aquimonas sp. TaxID=385483 RepID=UPI002636867D|nr:YggS family pyridoxal phosphate-dependent enzyme [uncultured Aquimonas sp.]